jgi:hypothetical protein
MMDLQRVLRSPCNCRYQILTESEQSIIVVNDLVQSELHHSTLLIRNLAEKLSHPSIK